jgi:hypothetical protein
MQWHPPHHLFLDAGICFPAPDFSDCPFSQDSDAGFAISSNEKWEESITLESARSGL